MSLSIDPAAHCIPRSGPGHLLDADSVRSWLVRHLPERSLVEDGAAITRSFAFADYYHTMAFVNALAFIAHREDHHPDLSVHYNRVVVRFSTHDVGGLSENDLLCALKTDALTQ